MKRHGLLLLAGIGGLAVASSIGCGGKQWLSSPTGTGGAAGKGGAGAGGTRTMPHPGAGGAWDGGEMPALDGGDSAGPGSTGTQTTCVAADGGVVGGPDQETTVGGDAGACVSLPADAPTFPWALEPQLAGGSGGDASIASGCLTTLAGGELVDAVCSGAAWLRPNGGAGGSGGNVPSLTWDDGSRLSWQPAGVDASIPPPIAPGAADQRVWAQLESHGWLAISGQCGWAWDQAMEVRDAPGGRIRFMARQGAGEPEPSQADLTTLFGVG